MNFLAVTNGYWEMTMVVERVGSSTNDKLVRADRRSFSLDGGGRFETPAGAGLDPTA